MYSEACAFLVQAAPGTQVLMFCRMRRWRKDILALVDMGSAFSMHCARDSGHAWWEMMVLLLRRGYTTIKYKSDINGEESGGNDSEGDDKGGKGDGCRGYEDDGDDGDDNSDGGDGGNNDTKQRQRQR